MESLRPRRNKCQSPREISIHYIAERIDPPYLSKKFINDYKGWGVFANANVKKGDFILEYRGKRRTVKEMKQIENQYDDAIRSYIFYFDFNGKKCIDATEDDKSLGRLVNDSLLHTNAEMKKIVTFGYPHLCLFATRDIKTGEEILYSYGEKDLPWHFQEKEEAKKLMEQASSMECDSPKDLRNYHEEGTLFEVDDHEEGTLFEVDDKVNDSKAIKEKEESKKLMEQASSMECDSPKDLRNYHEEGTLFEVDDHEEGTLFEVDDKVNDSKAIKEKEESKKLMEQASSMESDDSKDFSNHHEERTLFEVDKLQMKTNYTESLAEAMQSGNVEQARKLMSDWERSLSKASPRSKSIDVHAGPFGTHCSSAKNANESVHFETGLSGIQCNSAKNTRECVNVEAGSSGTQYKSAKRANESDVEAGPSETQWNCAKKTKESDDHEEGPSGTQCNSEKTAKKPRRKIPCPIPSCSEEVVNLKKHLMSKKDYHRWTYKKAQSAVSDFGLRKVRKDKTEKARKRTKMLCTICVDVKPFARIHNHLRDFHHKSGKELRKALKKCLPVVEGDLECVESSSSAESSDSEAELKEEESRLKWYFTCEMSKDKPTTMLESMSDTSDDDWLGQRYKNIQLGMPTFSYTSSTSDEESEDELVNNIGISANASQKLVEIEQSENFEGNEEDESEDSSNDIIDHEFDSAEDMDNEDMDDGFVMSSIDEDNHLCEFIKFLCSVDGGAKPERCAKKHARTLQLVLRYREQSNSDFKLLTNRSFLNQWISFCREKSEESEEPRMKAGTVRTYLGSLQHYHHFLEITDDKTDMSHINRLQSVIKGWKRQLWKDIERRKHQKNLLDLENFPQPSEIKSFDESDIVKEARKTVKFQQTLEGAPSQVTFCLVRDYLLTSLILDNASRPSAISNMTLGQFHKGERQSDGVVVGVTKHKTDYKGPAFISFSHDLYKDASGYINVMRNRLPDISKKPEDPIFVSYYGLQMLPNMVTTQMSKLWQRCVGTGSHINPTIVRKYTTTEVHSKHADLKKDTANLLCHDERTASSCYNIVNKKDKAATTSCKLKQVQRGESAYPSKESVLRIFRKHINKGFIHKKEVDVVVNTNKDLEKFRTRKGFKKVLDLVRYAIKRSHKNAVFSSTSDEESEPDSDCSIGDTKVTQISIQSETMQSEAMQSESMQSESSQSESSHSESSHSESSHSESRKPVTSKSSDSIEIAPLRRKAFSLEENKLIRKHLSSYIETEKRILRPEFEAFVKGIPELNDLLNRFGVAGLTVKVRTERMKC